MSATGPNPPTSTEDAPPPSWIEPELDRALAPVAGAPGIASLRGAWLDRVAAAGPADDLAGVAAAATEALLRGLAEADLPAGTRDRLRERLDALALELAERS